MLTLLSVMAIVAVLAYPAWKSGVSTPTSNKITFVQQGGISGGFGGAITPPMPTFAVGDFLVISCLQSSAVTPTISAGWTLLASGGGNATALYAFSWYRMAQAGDTAPTITPNGGASIAASIASYRSTTGSPIDVVGAAFSTGASGSVKILTVAGITTLTVYDTLLMLGLISQYQTTDAITYSGTFALDGTVQRDSINTDYRLLIVRTSQATAGATGDQTITSSKTYNEYMNGILVALKTT